MKTAKILVSLVLVGVALVFTAGPAFAATLSLSPATATKNVGDTFNVDIVLDTDGDAVSGATALINYDKDKLAVVDGDSNASGVNIQPNLTNLSQVLTNSVNASTGQIRYDAGNLGSPYTGRGIIATITFKANSVGTAQASFVFSSSSTTNTSAVAAASGPTNLLEIVNDGSFTINAEGSTPSTSTTPPATGVVEDTILLLMGGFGLLAGAFVFAKKALLF